MSRLTSMGNRLRDWFLLVASSTSLSLAVVTAVLHVSAGNLLDQVLLDRGLPGSRTIALVLTGLTVACGVAYVLCGRRSAEHRDRPERAVGRQIGS